MLQFKSLAAILLCVAVLAPGNAQAYSVLDLVRNLQSQVSQLVRLMGQHTQMAQVPESGSYTLPQSGEAVAIGGNTAMSVAPTGEGWTTGAWEYSLFDSYGGGQFVPTYSSRGAYVLAGTGGHGHPDNTGAAIFDFSTGLWSRLDNSLGVPRKPSSPWVYSITESNGAPYYELPGTEIPMPPHPYATLTYLPIGTRGSVAYITRSAIGGESHTSPVSHIFDLATGAWSRFTTATTSRAYVSGDTVYDTDRNRVWLPTAITHNYRDVQYLDLNDLTWKVTASAADWPSSILGTYDARAFMHEGYLMKNTGVGGLWLFDPDQPTDGWIHVSVSGTLPNSSNRWALYSDGKYYAVSGDTATHDITRVTPPVNPKTGTWVVDVVTLTGAILPAKTGITNHYTRLFYVPAIDSIAWIAGGTNSVIIFKPAPGSGVPTPVNGSCGSSHGSSFASAPATNLCAAGPASSVTTNSSTYTWSCFGSGGGTNASCSATRTGGTPAPTVTFSSSPTAVEEGQSAALTWSTTNSIGCTASGGWSGSKSTSGSQSVFPSQATTYTLTCGGSGGTTSESVVVAVSSPAPVLVDGENTMLITNVSSSTLANYPLRFSRIFLEGEIDAYPRVVIDGSPLVTQADVKQRWDDGSVKQAIMAVVIPSLQSGDHREITFVNQAGGNTTAPTKAALLDSAFNFDAVTELTYGGVTKSASARTMLLNDDYVFWTQGTVASTILLGDHTTDRAYDIGFDAYEPFRPTFEATFWHGLNKVEVRYIGEVSNSEELETIDYDLELTLGYLSPEMVYTQNDITHVYGTRWFKTYWIGSAPERRVNLNHHVGYLKETRLIPNYDTSIEVTESAISTMYNAWIASERNITDPGVWDPIMGNAGGRDDIGPLPTWTILWLYTGDWRMREVALGAAELAGGWTAHYREGDPDKNLLRTDVSGVGTGLGKVISITNRETLALNSGIDYSYTNADDRLNLIGSDATPGRTFDGAHQPDPYSVQYALTGTFSYLEQMYLWAGASAAAYNGAGTGYHYGRGPTGAEGGIQDQTRGKGWVMRNRALTAFLAPDSHPEKVYFTTLIYDAIALWEGQFNVTDGTFYNTTIWNWRNAFDDIPTSNPLRFIEKNSGMQGGNPEVGGGQSPWMVNMMIYGLAAAKELGYPTDALLRWVAPWSIGMITDPTFNPYMMGVYQQPTGPMTAGYYETWAEVKDASVPEDQARTSFTSLGDYNHGYANIAVAAASFLTEYPGGTDSWEWLETNGYDVAYPGFEDNPKWAILPRALSSSSNTPTITFVASPDTITNGESTSLIWISTNSTSCTAGGGWSGSKATSGNQSVSPAVHTIYTLTCTGPEGSVARSITVTVGDVTETTAPTLAFTASKTTISSGDSVTFTWSSTDAVLCEAGGGWSGSKGLSGTVEVTPIETTTYALICTGASDAAVDGEVTITVRASSGGGGGGGGSTKKPPGITLTVDPLTTTEGGYVTITWSTTKANFCTASWVLSGDGKVSLKGRHTTLPLTESTTYSLICEGSGGKKTSTVTVGVAKYNLVSQSSTNPSGGNSIHITSPFTRDLELGDVGEDVRALQKFLNGQGFLVADTLEGSPGQETMRFGPGTARALARFQEYYASEILTPNGFTAGTGQFGPSTRRKIEALLGTTNPSSQSAIQAQIEVLLKQILLLQEELKKLQG